MKSRPNEELMHIKDIEQALVQKSASPIFKVPFKARSIPPKQTRYPRRESIRSKAMSAMKIDLHDISYDNWMEDRTRFRSEKERRKLYESRILMTENLDKKAQMELDEVWRATFPISSY